MPSAIFKPSRLTKQKIAVYVLFFGNLAGIFALWWIGSQYYIANPEGGNLLIALGRICGLLAEYFLLVQLVLIGRIRPLEHLFGFDRLNALHRVIGYSVAAFFLLHPLLLTAGYAESYGVP